MAEKITEGEPPSIKFYDTPPSPEHGSDPARPEVVVVDPSQTKGVLTDEVTIEF